MMTDNGAVEINGRVYPCGYFDRDSTIAALREIQSVSCTHWATDEAWLILDGYETSGLIGLPPLSLETRAFLAGAIAATLMKMKTKR